MNNATVWRILVWFVFVFTMGADFLSRFTHDKWLVNVDTTVLLIIGIAIIETLHHNQSLTK
jgi:hypothetical protein